MDEQFELSKKELRELCERINVRYNESRRFQEVYNEEKQIYRNEICTKAVILVSKIPKPGWNYCMKVPNYCTKVHRLSILPLEFPTDRFFGPR